MIEEVISNGYELAAVIIASGIFIYLLLKAMVGD